MVAGGGSVADHTVRDSDMESPSSNGWIISVLTLSDPSAEGDFYVKIVSETEEAK